MTEITKENVGDIVEEKDDMVINADTNVHILPKDRKLIIDIVPLNDTEMEKIIDDMRKDRKLHIELGGRMYDSICSQQEYHSSIYLQ